MAKVTGQQVTQAQLQKAEFKSPNGKAPDGAGELYTVQQGDSMWAIAEQKLGDGNLWELIAGGNPQVQNPERIFPGDQLRMPDITPRLGQDKVHEKTGLGDVSEQLKGFEDNEQSGVIEKKQLGGLNLLQQKKELERADMPQPKAGDAAQMKRADMPQPEARPKSGAAQQVVPEPKTGAPDKVEAQKPAPLDESVGRAIGQLKQEQTPITGEAMQRAIKDGISDLDRKAASEEYTQLKGFVENNADKFSPEAMEKMAVYDKYAQAAQKKGKSGLTSKKLDKMFTEMDRVGIDAHIKEAHADAKALYGAMKQEGGFRPGTDEQKIFDTLGGKSKDQLQAIEQQYPKATKGRDLRKDLKSELSGNEEKRALALLDGKQPVADSARLNQAINGNLGEHADLKWGADAKEIKDTLKPRSLDERKEIEQTYQKEFGKELREDLKDLKGAERKEAMDLLDGKDLKPATDQAKQPGAAPPPKGETRPIADKPIADKPEASKLDESASRAISRLEDASRPISGNMMGAAIKDGISDLDGKAAGQEYDQLKGFVKENWNDLSADAKAKWGVYDKQAKKAQKEGLTGIPNDRATKMFARMDKAGYLDESSGQAIEGLKAQKKPISGEAMKAALLKGTEDWDGGTANEYRDFANYAAKNDKKLSPEAQKQWGIYDKHAQAAISSPEKGFTDARWNAMLSEMEGKGAAKAGGKGDAKGIGDKKITEESKPGAAKGERPKPGAEAKPSAEAKPTPESRPGRPVPEDIKPAVEAKPSATEGATVQRNYDDAAALFGAMKSAGGFRPGTDEAAVFKTMEAPGFDAKGATEAYKKAYNRDLRKDLKSELSGNEERRGIALLDGNRPLADAARLNKALKGNAGAHGDFKWGADAGEINKTLEGLSGAQIRDIQDAYQKEFGSTLRADLADDLKGADKTKALGYMDAGAKAEKSAAGRKPGEGKAAAAAPDSKPGDNKVAAGQPEVRPGANKPAAGQPEVGAPKSGGTKDAKFDWMGVPEDARSPEMKELLTQIQAMQAGAPPTPQVTKDMMTEQAQYAQQYPGAAPTLDREMAELAQKAGIKSPMSFEDLLFLMKTKYAKNKEAQILDKANELNRGGGAAQAGGQPGAAPYSGDQQPVVAPQTNNLTPQQQAEVQQWMADAEKLMASMPPAAQQLMQDKQAYDAQVAGQTAPFQGLPVETQAKVAAIIDGLDQRLLAYSQVGSEADQQISLNEVNDLINLASQVPPEMLPAMKAAALEIAMGHDFTPEAAQAMATFVSSEKAGGQPGAAPPTGAYDPATGYGRTAPAGTQQVDRRQAELQQQALADAARLNSAMKGNLSWLPKPGTDEASIMDTLKGWDAKDMETLEKAYAKQYGHSLRDQLTGELSGNEERAALALLDGKPEKTYAAMLDHAMDGNYHNWWTPKFGTNEDKIFNVLESCPADKIADMEREYADMHGRDLRDHLKAELSGNEERRALALLDGNKALADAAQLNQAMKGNRTGGWGFKVGTDEDKIFDVLKGKSPEQMRDIIAAYEKEFGKTLRGHIMDELSGNEETRALALLDLAERAKD